MGNNTAVIAASSIFQMMLASGTHHWGLDRHSNRVTLNAASLVFCFQPLSPPYTPPPSLEISPVPQAASVCSTASLPCHPLPQATHMMESRWLRGCQSSHWVAQFNQLSHPVLACGQHAWASLFFLPTGPGCLSAQVTTLSVHRWVICHLGCVSKHFFLRGSYWVALAVLELPM